MNRFQINIPEGTPDYHTLTQWAKEYESESMPGWEKKESFVSRGTGKERECAPAINIDIYVEDEAGTCGSIWVIPYDREIKVNFFSTQEEGINGLVSKLKNLSGVNVNTYPQRDVSRIKVPAVESVA